MDIVGCCLIWLWRGVHFHVCTILRKSKLRNETHTIHLESSKSLTNRLPKRNFFLYLSRARNSRRLERWCDTCNQKIASYWRDKSLHDRSHDRWWLLTLSRELFEHWCLLLQPSSFFSLAPNPIDRAIGVAIHCRSTSIAKSSNRQSQVIQQTRWIFDHHY